MLNLTKLLNISFKNLCNLRFVYKKISTMEAIIKETDNRKLLINITILDDNENFKKISPFAIHKSLNLISDSWDWIKYTNNYKTLTIIEKSEEKMEKFLKLKQIEINKKMFNLNINRILPINHSKGVIYSKALLILSDEEILNNLKSQNACEIYRFKKHVLNGTSIEYGSFAITFANLKRPETVQISFLNLQVYPLWEKPMQCKHCMLIGHTIKRCKMLHESFCKNCFHRTLNEKIHNCIDICKNCKGTHMSNVKNCPSYIKEESILRFKTSEQISYHEAKIRFNSKAKHSSIDSNIFNKLEENQAESAGYESKILVEEQNATIKRLTEENENLNQQLTILMKKNEINKNLTNEILSQLKKSTDHNTSLAKINQEYQQKDKNIDEILDQYRKTCETAQYWKCCMKQFIDQNKKRANDFQKYMELVINKNDSSEEEQ